MKLTTTLQRWVTGAVLAAVLATTLAPIAEAGRGNGRVRYKGGHGPSYQTYNHRYPGSTYYVRRSNTTGALIGGFLGGLFLGAVLANAAPAGYVYYDPYCGERFRSLDSYEVYYRRHHFRHPRVVRVIEVRTNRVVREYRYGDEGWRDDGYNDDRGYRDERDGREYDNRDYRDNDDRDYEDEDGE